MKKIIYTIIIIFSTAFIFSSCEDIFGDYLEKPPGTDVTIDSLFSSVSQMQVLLAACYEQALIGPWEEVYIIDGGGGYYNNIWDNIPFFSTISDEGEHEAPWWMAHTFTTGGITTADRNFDRFYTERFYALRQVNLLYENVDRVPDASQELKNQIKAEARHLRAEVHFNMFRRQGGIPIVDRSFKPSETEDMQVPRSTVEETVNFIVADLDYAIQYLPDEYPSSMRGRITKGAALALKSRVLLFAASPLYNTGSPPLSMSDPSQNNLICYGNYDENRWQKAAQAAKAVLDWAPAGNINLITDQGVDKNYRYVWEINDNREIILADKHANENSRGITNRPFRYWMCNGIGGQQGVEPTQNFIEEHYEKLDGTLMDWPEQDTNLTQRYAELEHRFHQTIAYNGFFWNQDKGNVALYDGGAHVAGNITGYFVKKWIPDEVTGAGSNYDIDFIRYRLAEFYLNYAEALNEYQGPVTEAYEAVNTIRARSGMPPLPGGLTKEEFRERVQRERSVEFAFESHRWWDLRRWRTAHEVLSGPFYGLKIYKNTPETDPLTFRYEKYAYEQRIWKPEYYHYFFPTSEIDFGFIVQNPGW